MQALNKEEFLLWFYNFVDSIGKSLGSWDKHHMIAIIEKYLAECGFTTGYKFAGRVFGPYDEQLQIDFENMVSRRLLRGDGSRGEQPASPMLTEYGAVSFEILFRRHLKDVLGTHYDSLEKRMQEVLSLSPREILQLANT